MGIVLRKRRGGGVALNVYANNLTAEFTGWEHSLRLLRKGEEPQEMKGEEEIFSIEDGAFIRAVRANDPSKYSAITKMDWEL